MPCLVLTIAVGPEHQRIAAVTHPSLRAYARRIGAEFLSIDDSTTTTPHWEKCQLARLLETYDRILYLDTDLIVRDDCPNLFDVVPPAQLGAFNEAPFTSRSRELIIDVCRQYGVTLPTWDGRYFNTGVLVVSQAHRAVFEKPELEVCNFYEQTWLNMRFAQLGVPMCDLPYQFNRMTCMDALTGEHRLASFIVHYAGARFLTTEAQLLDTIREDLRRWDESDWPALRGILVRVGGGLGDQIAAEPAVRFMRQHLYPNDDMIVTTHWPRLFRHLEALGVQVCEQGRETLTPDRPYYVCQTLPDPTTVQWAVVSHLMCHTVDYTAMALMHRTLPLESRSIKFKLRDDDLAALDSRLNGSRPFLADAVVVHPGRHWGSKTFPAPWWHDVLSGLVAEGERVIVVGKDDEDGSRGCVDVVCPDGVIDLRNQLSLGAMAALLSRCRVLVSNDSAPVHLAGAFDPWIVLIPSCKHPDHILPFRHGSIRYKTKALWQRLVIDDVESRPTQVYPTTVDVPDVEWDRYLPEPAVVVAAVKECRS